MKTKKQINEIINKLKNKYPEAKCSLDFNNSYEMLIAVLLSAQCTDERVNKTTPKLFEKYNSPEKMLSLNNSELEKYISSINFFKVKANNILKLSKILVEEFNGIVPDNMEELMKLPGIGRKSANVIMLEAFNNPQGVAIDTHAKRISNRIGISNKEDPSEIEKDILLKLDKKDYYDANHLFVWHGRYTCKARKPECTNCPITDMCDFYIKQIKK